MGEMRQPAVKRAPGRR